MVLVCGIPIEFEQRVIMSAYYQFLDRQKDEQGVVATRYRSTQHAQGAWNEHEQHMAPASGIIAAELEQFEPRDDVRIGRISYDIFGLIAAGEFAIVTRIVRPGKTIELLESELVANGRTCIVARAWRMCVSDSSEVGGLEDLAVQQPDALPVWDGMEHWPGGFIDSIEARAVEGHRAGKGIVWINTPKDMVEGQPTSEFVHLMGLVDTANGIVPRQGSQISWAYPNLDLQVHLYRLPTGRWLGIEAVQQFGDDGIGLTSAVLHDVQGPFGRSEQILTLRKIG